MKLLIMISMLIFLSVYACDSNDNEPEIIMEILEQQVYYMTANDYSYYFRFVDNHIYRVGNKYKSDSIKGEYTHSGVFEIDNDRITIHISTYSSGFDGVYKGDIYTYGITNVDRIRYFGRYYVGFPNSK